ncbi:MAG: ATP-binding cassette domain-containing protein [Lysobacterales bacterium]|jgi:ATP-binding cassette subfamily F protein 3
MLQLKQVELRRGGKLLLEGATMQAHPGQRVGVIGVNGCGKSSLFALIRGQLECDAGELHHHPDAVIAHVAQENPDSDKPALEFTLDGDRELRTLQSGIAELEAAGVHDERSHAVYARMEDIDGFTAEARAARLLHGLGFGKAVMHRPVNEFSGGWRMRLALAQALMCRSDILLLDEPTNHLDLPAIIWLERWLKAYTGILLLISHDRDFLDALCTHIAHIEQQGLKNYTGNYSRFEAVRAEQLALQQSMFEKQQKQIRHMQSYVDRFRYKKDKARQAQSRLKMLERMVKIAPAHVDSQFSFHFLEPERQPQQLLKLEGATLGYGEHRVVGDLRFQLGAGDRVGLLGANGAGKSTLVKALVDGSTLLDGERTVHDHARIGYFAQQQLDLLRMDCSPLWHVQRQAPGVREADLRKHLGHFGFHGERVDEPVAPFSGGEKARLVLAMLVLQRPNLLLLDEPTNHLDLEMRHALSVALTEYGGALLVISHDRHLLRSVCDELYIAHDGRVREFRESLDAYPAWLKAQEDKNASEGESQGSAPAASGGKRKRARRADAERRQQLKPFSDRVRKADKAMTRLHEGLRSIEDCLHDEDLYASSARKDELAELMRRQAALKEQLAGLESEWLEAHAALEQAEGDLEPQSSVEPAANRRR